MKALAALLTSAWVTMSAISTFETAYTSQSTTKNEVQRPVVLWKPAVSISTAVNSVSAAPASPTIQHCVETILAENLNSQIEKYRF